MRESEQSETEKQLRAEIAELRYQLKTFQVMKEFRVITSELAQDRPESSINEGHVA